MAIAPKTAAKATAASPAADPRALAPALRITSALPGLYLCGVMHPDHAIDYPAGWFTLGQLAEMQAHPALSVEVLPEAAAA